MFWQSGDEALSSDNCLDRFWQAEADLSAVQQSTPLFLEYSSFDQLLLLPRCSQIIVTDSLSIGHAFWKLDVRPFQNQYYAPIYMFNPTEFY